MKVKPLCVWAINTIQSAREHASSLAEEHEFLEMLATDYATPLLVDNSTTSFVDLLPLLPEQARSFFLPQEAR